MFSQLLATQHFFSKWGREQGTHGHRFPSCSTFARLQPIFFDSFYNTCASLCHKGFSKYTRADQCAAIFETNQPCLSCPTPLKFPQRLKRCTLFWSLAQGKGIREHSGQTFTLCEYSHLPSLQKKQTGQLPTPLGTLAFCTKAAILPRQWLYIAAAVCIIFTTYL